MSDIPKETHLNHKLTSESGVNNIRGIQGNDDDNNSVKKTSISDLIPTRMDINASEFQPETQKTLSNQGLGNPDEILADVTGNKAEIAVRTILKNEGLPEGNLNRETMKDVVSGHYNNMGHGIDLVGVTNEGQPVPIEIKKRQIPSQDSMGHDSAKLNNIEPETVILRDEILKERQVNPAVWERIEDRDQNITDQELSLDQMGGLWTRDRWLKLAKDDSRREQMLLAGVREEYLDLEKLSDPNSHQWNDILDGRTTIVVTSNKDEVSSTLKDQALFQRGCNVAVINLKA